MSLGSPMSMDGDLCNQEEASSSDDNEMLCIPDPSPPRKRFASRFEAVDGLDVHDFDAVVREFGAFEAEQGEYDENMSEESNSDSEDMNTGPDAPSTEDDSTSSGLCSDESSGAPEFGANESDNSQPDQWIRDQFRTYCADARQNFVSLTEHEVTAVRLLHLLKEKGAPMNTYESLMLWHLKQSKKLREHETLSDFPHFIGRKTLMKRLAKRYNYENKFPYQKALLLPVSGTKVNITCHDAKATLQRLLTDPRIKPMDYLFWDQNPLAPPPENLDYVMDLNTGKAYLDTYALLVTEEGQQLMGVTLYTDGTAVSHFHDMEIIQVNIALGIMTREARNRAYCWAPLGYIEKVHEQGGRGRTILKEANHLESQDGQESVDSDETVILASGVGDSSAQDFHAMMSVVLEDFVELQNQGFLWDHYDTVLAKLHQNIHYHLFVPFIKADSKEADLICGKYAQRFSAQQICRKCHIPLSESDDHLAKHKLKTADEIRKLVQNADLPGLKALSQTYLTNAFHSLRFSLGNRYGVHGSCPSEMLHAFLLGTFKYLRDIFFEMVGTDSEGARQMNALAKVYSRMFSRQSDQTMPGTAFTRGIQVGKLMAKDYRGVLLSWSSQTGASTSPNASRRP